MPTNIVISGVTGQSPFNVYVCDDLLTNCSWVSTFTSIPFSFELPMLYLGETNFAVKLIDFNGCSVIKYSGTTYAECL
jgi:hypothetical protein